MAWQDRSYYRDRPAAGFNPLMWLLSGSVRLFGVFGIEVRAHASLVVLVVLVLLSELLHNTLAIGVTSMSILFVSVLLHEFGHCFAARAVGGSANDILLWPLGGLAYASPPDRPLPTFITVAAGPLVNLLLCGLSAAGLWLTTRALSGLHPYLFEPLDMGTWYQAAFYLRWIYSVNLMLLLFNLLPIYPLDGGQMVQSILWPIIGYLRSMIASCWVGMIGSVLLVGYGMVQGVNLFLITLAICLFINCYQRLAVCRAAALDGYAPDPVVYQTVRAHHHRPSRWSAWRARRRIRQEEAEQTKVDQILEKVSLHGMHSLSWRERRVLRVATEHQRAREMEDVR